jgi:sugar/nucleoside kinase (ribokinase family)
LTTCCAVVVGHICLDFIPTMGHVPEGKLASLLKPGHLLITGPAAFSTGGPVSNTGLALHRLGIDTRLIAKVGADPLGNIVRGIVEQHAPSLSQGLVIDPASSTSYAVILSAPGVDRIFLHYPGANDTFSVSDVDFDLVCQSRLMHFGYPPVMKRMYSQNGRELVDLFRRAKQCGVTTSLDMTYPDPDAEGGKVDWRAILQDVLPYVDIFLPSFDELMFMLRREECDRLRSMLTGGDLTSAVSVERLEELSTELLEMGSKMVVIKAGGRGLYLRTAEEAAIQQMGHATPDEPYIWAEREMWTACFKVDVIGTTGAGDATIAGFLSALLRGLDPYEALTTAVGVGACNVEAADALSGLRSWDETRGRIEAGWDHLPMALDAPGWVEMRDGLWEKTVPRSR